MILDSPKIKNAILTALADPEVVSILDCTMDRSKSVCDIIRETDMPHTTAYRKIKWLVDENFLLLIKSQLMLRARNIVYSIVFSDL